MRYLTPTYTSDIVKDLDSQLAGWQDEQGQWARHEDASARSGQLNLLALYLSHDRGKDWQQKGRGLS